jgi:hypothetical protein
VFISKSVECHIVATGDVGDDILRHLLKTENAQAGRWERRRGPVSSTGQAIISLKGQCHEIFSLSSFI